MNIEIVLMVVGFFLLGYVFGVLTTFGILSFYEKIKEN